MSNNIVITGKLDEGKSTVPAIFTKLALLSFFTLMLIIIKVFDIGVTHSESFIYTNGIANSITGHSPPNWVSRMLDYSELLAAPLIGFILGLFATSMIRPKTTSRKIFLFSTIAITGYLLGKWVLANSII